MPLRIDIVTIFPQVLEGFLGESMMKRAAAAGLVEFRTINPRDFTRDRHRTTDDKPYGGGPGMVMMPGPIFEAVESVRTPGTRVVLLSPQGRVFNQKIAVEFSTDKHIVLVCGHYEGVDERIRLALATEELSVGDYVLTNGAVASAVVIDAAVRLIPGVLGAEDAVAEESFTDGKLEYPQYTRPAEFRGMKVPEVLRSGDHKAVADWREKESRTRTETRRPDLLRHS